MIQTLTIEKLQTLCGTVQRCFPRAHVAIAGGAPRDILNGKAVKDIDVFIQLTGKANEEDRFLDGEWAADWVDGCTALGEALYCPWQNIRLDGEEANNRRGYSYGAFTLVDYTTGFHMHPVQLVFIDEHPVDNVTRHFDFGLSQVWVTPAQLRMTSAYWRDRERKTITYLQSTEPNQQRRQSSRERLERLRVKYAGWRFDRCWQLDEPAPPIEIVPSSDCAL